MICIFVILLSGWCRTRMRPARLVSYAFLYTTYLPFSNAKIFITTTYNEGKSLLFQFEEQHAEWSPKGLLRRIRAAGAFVELKTLVLSIFIGMIQFIYASAWKVQLSTN